LTWRKKEKLMGFFAIPQIDQPNQPILYYPSILCVPSVHSPHFLPTRLPVNANTRKFYVLL
jgi:hypothetical protein